MEGRQVVAGEAGDAVDGGQPAVGVVREHRRGKTAGQDRVGLGLGLADAGDGARLLALDRRGGEARLLDQGGEELHRPVALGRAAEGAQGEGGAVHVGAAAELGAEVGHPVGDGVLVEAAGTGVEQAAGEPGEAGLAGGHLGAGGAEVHLHVDDGQGAALDEHDLAAGGRGPGLDRQPGLGRESGQGQRQGQAEALEGVKMGNGHRILEIGNGQWRCGAAARSRAWGSTGSGSRRAMVRVSSLKYLRATACTSAGVTARMRSSM